MLVETREQPAALERVLREHAHEIAEAATALRRRRPPFVVFVARGTSHNAAIYGQYMIETFLRIPTGTAMPSVTTLYGRTPDWRGAAVIGISQSGRSVDVTEVLAAARRQGALTVGITNDPASPMAEGSHYVLPLAAGPEHSVAATKTFTSSLAVLAALVAGWAEAASLARGLRRLPAAAAAAIERDGEIRTLARRRARRDPWVVTTRGYMLGVADEMALKLKETSYAAAESLSAAALMHGPIAALDRRTTVLLLLPPGKSRGGLIDLREQLRGRSVATLTFALDGGPAEVPIRAGLGEPLAPIAAAPAVHLFAYHLSVARGLNPDKPRGLRKVTPTR